MPVASPRRPVDGDGDASASQKNIWVAAGEGDIERVRHLIEAEGLSATAADQWTYTPLHAAASYGQIDMLRFLLTHPSTPENAIETTDEDGDTPLFAAEDVETAQLLVEEFGADSKRENAAGDTPAANAEENERVEVAAYLRGVTGEAPMYSRAGPDGEDDDAEGEDSGGVGSALESEIEQRTDALMERVAEILARARERGANSGEELNEEEEEELRRVVGESLFTQIREGWNSTGAADGENAEGERGLASSDGIANGSAPPQEEADGEADTRPLPGR